MSIRSLAALRLANILCMTISRVFLILSNSVLKTFLAVLPKPSGSNDELEDIYEYEGEAFTLSEIADLLMMDPSILVSRIRNGETLKQIVDGPSV